MRVLVLGGYGLIGEAIVNELLREGFEVAGLGRTVAPARRRCPQAEWISADLSQLATVDDWRPLIAGRDAVVNAAGALQDGWRDDVRAVQERAIIALIEACEAEGVAHFVQVSAVGAAANAATSFFRTKAVADAALRASRLRWAILRPGLVVAPAAYGSTGLVRALAGFPFAVPLVMAEKPVQTVDVADVARAVRSVLRGELPAGTDVDLVEDKSRSLGELVMLFRARLGLPPGPVMHFPSWLSRPVTLCADALGWLGWRSPLRSTAMSAIASGVTGNPEPYRALTGRSLSTLPETLARLPAGVQELWFARLWLLKPAILGGLALFFFLSGVIGLVRFDAAMSVLMERGVPHNAAFLAVAGGSLADIVLGLAVLIRRTARLSLIGMAFLTAGYAAAAAIVTPDLWADPLGPLVKTLPVILLCLAGLAVLEER